MSYGFSDGTNHRSVCANAKSEGVWQFNTSETFRRSASCVYTSLGDGTNVTEAECTVTGFANNQFSLSWTTNNAVADVIHYIVMQVDNVKVGEFTAKITSTGTQDTTGLGFTPVDGDLILFLSASGTAALPSTVNHGLLTVGAMSKSTARGTATVSWENAATTTDTHTLQKTDKALSLCTDSTGAIDAEADFSAWISDGFRLNWTDFAASAWKIFYLAIHGGNWDVGNDTQPTSNQVKTTTVAATVDDVKGLMLFSANLAAASTVQEGGRMSIGTASSTTAESGIWSQMLDAIANNVLTNGVAVREHYTNKILSCQTSTTDGSGTDLAPAINSQCDVDSFGTDQFALNWTTTDATARQFLYVVVGIAGFTQFNRSPSADSVTVADSSLTRILSAARVPSSDSTTVSDASLNRQTQAFRTVSTDTVDVVENSLTRSKTWPRQPSDETVTVSDASTTRMLSATRAPSADSPVISEDLTRILSASRTISTDSTTVVDSSLTRILSFVRSPSADSITAEDSSTTQILTRVRLPTTEDIPVSDSSLIRLLQLFRSPSSDSVTVGGENVSRSKLLERVPSSDSITVTESSLTRLLQSLRAPSTDTIAVTEDVQRSKTWPRVPSADSVTAEDSSTTRSITRIRVPTAESITVEESSLTRLLSLTRVPSADSITIAEASLSRLYSALRLPSTDSVTTSENVSRVHTTAGQFNRAPDAESITVGENLTRILQLFRVPSADSITVSENLSGGRLIERVAAADTVNVVEQSLTRIKSAARNVEDTSNVIEASLTRLLQAMRSPSLDTVTVAELQSLISHSRALQETITVSEPTLTRIVTAIRTVVPENVDIAEQVFYQALHKFVFDSVIVAEQLFSEREQLGGSMSYATPAEVRPLLGNLGAQRTDAQIQLAVDSAYDEINRKTNRIPPNDWKDTEPDYSIIKKIARYKAALEMSIGIKDFEDREAMQKEIDEMFMIIEQHDPGGVTSNDMVISSADETYALNPEGIIWSTRYPNLKKSSTSGENNTTINPDT